MNYTTAIFLVNSDVRCVTVSYELEANSTKGKKPFVPYKTLDRTIVVGDYVVVPTGTRHDMTVCRVEDVDVEVDFDNPYQMDWLVQKLDLSANKAILAQEAGAIEKIKSAEKRAKVDELKRKLMADNPALAALGTIHDTGPAPEYLPPPAPPRVDTGDDSDVF